MAIIRKGDTVVVLSGKDKGKSGKVLRVFPQAERALVDHINLMKHFERPSQQNKSGGIVEREVPIALCKLALVSPKTRKPTRISWEIQDGKKVRVCRGTGEVIDSK